jgi:hypothetical protein
MSFEINIHKIKLMRVKADKMKNIVFSKLCKHDTYYKVKSMSLRQKVWKGLHEAKVGQSWKEFSNIKMHY